MVTAEELHAGTIYPDLRNIRQISQAIASAVCRLAWDQGLAQYAEPPDIREYVHKLQYHPAYRPYAAT
jgi:malate dehydrogenase (oxaloacetate-decarboxylating)(NADP+)